LLELAVRAALLTLLTDAPGGVSLARRVGAAGPGSYAAVMLGAALVAAHPEWTDEPTVRTVISGLMSAWRAPPRFLPGQRRSSPGQRDGAASTREKSTRESGKRDIATSDLVAVLSRAAVVTSDMVSSPIAGVLLLLRAAVDLRVPAVLARAGFTEALAATLLAVATRLTGATAEDPAALLFAGQPVGLPDSVQDVWRRADEDQCAAVHEEMMRAVRGQRLPLGTGSVDPAPSTLLGNDAADDTLNLVALAVLRAWSRWLGRFASASVPYLAGHFLCRPGSVRLTVQEVVVELTAGPLDVVLQLAGYDSPVPVVPWLDGRRVTYRLGAG
jgi:hypothetical protein